jgi:hypothetical protein
MILIFAPEVSNRLRYISRIIFDELLGLGCAFTTFSEEFISYEGPKIAYAPKPPGDGLYIESVNFLFENFIGPQNLEFLMDANLPLIFPTMDKRSALPFDPLAAAFFMVSRYEEYEHHGHDKYGRFPAHSSIASRGGFLEIPVIHFWADKLGEIIVRHFPSVTIKRPVYSFVPTVDIDHAFAYRYRPASRILGGIARSFIHARMSEVFKRVKVLTGAEPDPYDTYSYIRQVHARFSLHPYYFILFADYGGDDNNVTVSNRFFHTLIRNLDQNRTVGIHPSLSSNKHIRKLEAEIDGLSQVAGRDITASRQHFLRISLPKTYRNLIHLGITDDFSMGYASHPGFRAGIAIPFHFFDLVKNEMTPLRIHPVTLMDVTLKDYLRLTTEQSIEKIHQMISMVRSVGGEFVSICHNEAFSEDKRWLGWRNIYEELLRFAVI